MARICQLSMQIWITNVLFLSCLPVVSFLWLFAEQRSSRLFITPRWNDLMSLFHLPCRHDGTYDGIFSFTQSLHKQTNSSYSGISQQEAFLLLLFFQTTSLRATTISSSNSFSYWKSCEWFLLFYWTFWLVFCRNIHLTDSMFFLVSTRGSMGVRLLAGGNAPGAHYHQLDYLRLWHLATATSLWWVQLQRGPLTDSFLGFSGTLFSKLPSEMILVSGHSAPAKRLDQLLSLFIVLSSLRGVFFFSHFTLSPNKRVVLLLPGSKISAFGSNTTKPDSIICNQPELLSVVFARRSSVWG